MFRIIFVLLPIAVFSQIQKVKTTPEDYQFMYWSVKTYSSNSNNFNYSLGNSYQNNLNNTYFFEYTPVFRDQTKLIGYAVKFNNKISGEERWTAIPFINPNELQTLFDQLMGWEPAERDSFLKSYLLFVNSNLLQ